MFFLFSQYQNIKLKKLIIKMQICGGHGGRGTRCGLRMNEWILYEILKTFLLKTFFPSKGRKAWNDCQAIEVGRESLPLVGLEASLRHLGVVPSNETRVPMTADTSFFPGNQLYWLVSHPKRLERSSID